MAEPNPPEQIIQAHHELCDLSPKYIVMFGGSLALVIVIVFWVSFALMHYYYGVEEASQPRPSPLAFNQPPMPEPRLIVTPGEEMMRLRKDEDSILQSYAWIDKQQGVARIPIERAIEILAQKGLPARTEEITKMNAAKISQGKGTQHEARAEKGTRRTR